MKKNKKFAVITSSDAKYGDFLANHWLSSLRDNIDTNLVEIIVLDYGLNGEQIKKIRGKAEVVKCKRDGQVVNIRYRDMLHVVKKDKYKQILFCDGGDVIFQKNIMNLFYENPLGFRATISELYSSIIDSSLVGNPVSEEVQNELINVLNDKKMINGGFLVADYDSFVYLCEAVNKDLIDKTRFGPDMIIFNYVLYKKGFIQLNRTYNYVIGTVRDSFSVKDGVFYDAAGDKIAVVHNAGGNGKSDYFRIIKNFGYGKEYNQINSIKKATVRGMNRLSFILKPFFRILSKVS